ncbi:4Fe-4S ferredoxin N-terminal domain-containing protein [Salinilacihabitans rarus]|uniref:4Fe-4S ferredoxin N-terminal domain-containing protein n=1 Tax=Salinilacihabitans rarus TaxID=2961596 RepID=UPI0020C844C6|nr:4Fe-4S ferredoxin N-terminal domain-containing protein [Salinilacihabitans rarus]
MSADDTTFPDDEDESFHPLGAEWESELEEMLDDTEYDTDLGIDMARDAMRVTKGELSEAEFHAKYHESVLDEFGVDDRPTAEAFEELEERVDEGRDRLTDALARLDGEDDESRREVMKKMGVGAAAVGLGAWGTVDDGKPEGALAAAESESNTEAQMDSDVQWGMTIDLERCDGCLSCMVACSQENQLDQGVNWMYVMAFEDELTSSPSPAPDVIGGTSDYNMLVRPCQHCTDAPCEKVCPTTARHTRDSDGLVLTDYDVCIGCRYCQVACPYGVNYFQWDEPDTPYEQLHEGQQNAEEPRDVTHSEYEHGEERWVDSRAPRGVMSKCTMCPSHQDGSRGEEMVGTTACETACPPNAIQFGNVKDERSDPYQHREHPTKSRTVIDIHNDVPSPETIDENLGQGDDLDAAIEAIDGLDRELVGVMKAVGIVSERLEPGEGENNSVLEKEQTVLASVDALEQYVDLESEDALLELGLGDGSEDDANARLRQFAGNPSSKFKLLEDVGTHPNVTYLGQEPGPEAEQVEGPTQYERIGLGDNRKEEVLDNGTVGDAGVSL